MDGRAVGTFSKSCRGELLWQDDSAGVRRRISPWRETRMPIQFAPSRGEPRRDAPLGPGSERVDGTSSDDPPPDAGWSDVLPIPPASDADAEACCRDRFLDHLKEKARFGPSGRSSPRSRIDGRVKLNRRSHHNRNNPQDEDVIPSSW